jgi:DNA-binding response OmpR family regulator
MDKPKTILIIDDDPVMIRWLSKRLQAGGYCVVSESDGAAGLETARRERPDLIVLDVMLPGLNGFSVCGFLRTDQTLYKVPIVMITSRQEECDQKFEDQFGPDAFLNKPFDMEQIFETVGGLI